MSVPQRIAVVNVLRVGVIVSEERSVSFTECVHCVVLVIIMI